MSTGTKVGAIFGAIIGGTIGWFVSGGNPLGDFQGAMLGMSLVGGIGGYLDPLSPDIDGLGSSDTNRLSYTTSTEGIVLPDLLGTGKFTGNFVWYDPDSSRNEEVTEEGESSGGKGMGNYDTPSTTSRKYYLTFIQSLCMGPVDNVIAIYENDTCVWKGNVTRPAGGVSTISISGIGSILLYFGTLTQPAPNLTNDDDSMAYTGQCFAYFYDCCIGDYNRVPTYYFVLRKVPSTDLSTDLVAIGDYDMNPAHMFYYICTQMCGISTSFMDIDEFNATAQQLYDEDFGLGMFLDKYTSAKSYLESILLHCDAVINWSIEGKLKMRLIRDDLARESIPVVSQDDMLEPMSFQRRSWLELVNEVKVQYTERYLSDCETEE